MADEPKKEGVPEMRTASDAFKLGNAIVDGIAAGLKSGAALVLDENTCTVDDDLLNRVFTQRERGLIANSVDYAANYPAGLPGHNLIIIIDKFHRLAAYLADYLTGDQLAALKARLKQAGFQGEEK